MYTGRPVKCLFFMSDFNKTGFFGQIFEKESHSKFNENPSCGSRVVPRGMTDGKIDMAKLTVGLHKFANAPKNSCNSKNLLVFQELLLQYNARNTECKSSM